MAAARQATGAVKVEVPERRPEPPSSVDPICGMRVTEADAAAREVVDGTVVLFCSEHCHQQFLASKAEDAEAAHAVRHAHMAAGPSDPGPSPLSPPDPDGGHFTHHEERR
jgi:YHS domain-containing protein